MNDRTHLEDIKLQAKNRQVTKNRLRLFNNDNLKKYETTRQDNDFNITNEYSLASFNEDDLGLASETEKIIIQSATQEDQHGKLPYKISLRWKRQ